MKWGEFLIVLVHNLYFEKNKTVVVILIFVLPSQVLARLRWLFCCEFLYDMCLYTMLCLFLWAFLGHVARNMGIGKGHVLLSTDDLKTFGEQQALPKVRGAISCVEFIALDLVCLGLDH